MPIRDHAGDTWHATARARQQPTTSTGRLAGHQRPHRTNRTHIRRHQMAAVGVLARRPHQPAYASTRPLFRPVTRMAMVNHPRLGGDAAAAVTR